MDHVPQGRRAARQGARLMRGLLSFVLAILLAISLPMGLQGSGPAAQAQAAPVTAADIAPAQHMCCTGRQKSAHGDCGTCALLGLAEAAPDMVLAGRAIRHVSLSRPVRTAAPRLPLPPPRSA